MDFDELKKYLDEKLEKIARKAADSKQKPIILKKKGNQAQADHASQLLDLIKRADDLIKDDDKEGARGKLKLAKKELDKRIKLIKLADKSEFGWDFVNEYVSDELASDSEDEKRMRRAENQAQAKRKKKQLEFPSKRLRTAPNQFFPDKPTSSKQFFRSTRQFQYNDKCFGCGRTGHWRIHCPGKGQSEPIAEQKPFKL